MTFSAQAIPSDTKSLVQALSVVRNAEGAVTVSGKLLLPKGTKLWIQPLSRDGNRPLAQIEALVQPGGSFSTPPFFYDDGSVPRPGPQKLEVFSLFRPDTWQPADVLTLIGENGSRLPQAALRPDDPEFPNGPRHLEDDRILFFPPISKETAAIEAVKRARLSVPDGGMSSESVAKVVATISRVGVTPLGWSASEKEPGRWVVTLDCMNGSAREQAQWAYNQTTRTVRYLDPLAKTLSWLPKE